MVQEAAADGRNHTQDSAKSVCRPEPPIPAEPTPAMIAPRRHPSSRPFLAAPRTDFYHPAKGIDAALHGFDRLVRRAEGIGLVVGPPGTGKSLLLAKLAESLRDDFDVALLSGARICTRRALWQSILAEIGEPYRGIDEAELRINVVERTRGLAATGSGLAVLVDEAHTLPTRLIEELRLLTNLPTPMPAVHIVLAGTAELEEMLGNPKMESFSQRIGGRFYLEPLDHAETLAYVRTQMKTASLDWDKAFEPGCDDAVFTASDGVPRLINQVCDLALVLVSEAGRAQVNPADIAAAWGEIQRLPAPTALARGTIAAAQSHAAGTSDEEHGERRHEGIEFADELDAALGDGAGVIEFGSFDGLEIGVDDALLEHELQIGAVAGQSAPASADPWHGPEVELVFDAGDDPFEEYFEQEERVVERYLMRGPEDFSTHGHVASREGLAMARQLEACERHPVPPVGQASACHDSTACHPSAVETAEMDDSDMVVIEEDRYEHPAEAQRKSFFAVRPGDYRSLFARLRRGDK